MAKMTKRMGALLCAIIMAMSMIALPPTAKAADTLKAPEGTKVGDSLGWFMIECGNDMSYVLNIKWGSKSNGGKLITYAKENSTNERFQLIYEGNHGGDDYFLIKAMHSGYYLHRSGNAADHRIVHQWNDTNNPNAHWVLELDGAGYFHLRNRNGGYMEASGRQNSQVWLSERKDNSAQKWRFISTSTTDYEKRSSIDDGWYMIQSASYNSTRGTDRVLDVENGSQDNGGNLLTCYSHGGNNQLFYVEFNNGCWGYYTIKARHSEKYMHKSGSDDGVNVHQWSGIGANAQWCLEPAGGDYYYLRNKNGGYMTTGDNNGEYINNVYVENFMEQSNQKWKFIRVDL